MPRRQILSSEEKERLLVVPDDDVLLTRMCFLSENDLALINKHRRPANRLGFAVLLCYLRGPGFPPDKSMSPHDGVVSRLAAHLKLQPDLWAEYASREVTRWEHLTELYRYLELSPFNRALQKTCIRHLPPCQDSCRLELKNFRGPETTKMNTYSPERKAALIARMMPPHNQSVVQLA
ncbi:DUF4158 domain-containing protein, partial [Serratia ficaria]|uniref:DUF4158 domain-containing protein n=1 Tax=Serratia ficaria TaxID=61651 RepID=UPI0021B7E44A